MADEGMTITGLEELRAAITAFPAALTARLRAVAEATAQRQVVGARERLRAQTHGHGWTADAIHIVEDAPNQTFRVESPSPKQYPANLVLWIEHGTIHQPARPYMRPASDAEQGRYAADLEAASVAVAEETFK